jgi:hypothetical protein
MSFSSLAMPSSLLFRSWDFSAMPDSVERKQSDQLTQMRVSEVS